MLEISFKVSLTKVWYYLCYILTCFDVIVVEISDLTIRSSKWEIQMVFFLNHNTYYLLVCNSLYLLSPFRFVYTQNQVVRCPILENRNDNFLAFVVLKDLHPKIDFFLFPTQNKNESISLYLCSSHFILHEMFITHQECFKKNMFEKNRKILNKILNWFRFKDNVFHFFCPRH